MPFALSHPAAALPLITRGLGRGPLVAGARAGPPGPVGGVRVDRAGGRGGHGAADRAVVRRTGPEPVYELVPTVAFGSLAGAGPALLGYGALGRLTAGKALARRFGRAA